MKLSSAQIAQYEEQGYLFFPDLLDSDEVSVLQEAVPEILNRSGPEIISEMEDPSSARLAFGRIPIPSRSAALPCFPAC